MHLRTRSTAALLALACASLAGPAAGQAADPSITLRMAVDDAQGRQSEPYVSAFIDEVAARTGGSVVVEPTWDAGGGASGGFEVSVAQQLVAGEADLALTAGRGWSVAGVKDLVALEAPFLITDSALASAVATSDIAARMLDGMASSGVTGLALWPEDLNHVVVFDACTQPPVAPERFGGLTVRAVPSVGVDQLLAAMGATRVFADHYAPLVDSCGIQAAVTGFHGSLPGFPTFIGDVALPPRYQVLAANRASFERLTDDQRAAIGEAAVAVRDRAIAEHGTDAAAAVEWCAGGGDVILAGPDGVAAFQAVGSPIVDAMAQDAATSTTIDAIRALKTSVEPAPAVEACSAAAVPSQQPTELTGFSTSRPPDGTYRIQLTAEDLLAAGAPARYASDNALTWTLTLAGDHWTGEGRNGSRVLRCAGTTTAVEGGTRMSTTQDGGCGFDYDIVWREAGDGIELHLLAVGGDPNYSDMASERAAMDRVWTRIDG